MFEDYIFGLNVDPDDDDPPLSPTSPSVFFNDDRFSPAAAPTIPDPASASNVNCLVENERIDRLAHELRKQASISDGQAQIRPNISLEEQSSPKHRAESLEMRDATPISTLRTHRPANGEGSQASFWQRVEAWPDIASADSEYKCSLETTPSRRARRQVDSRPQQHNNPCRENLLTTMVEHNMQCNVQTHPPEPPMLTSRPSTPRISPLAVSNGNPGLSGLTVFDDIMHLEVDPNYCEGEDEILLNDTVALREASAPAGVRKHGILRYRSSADAGVQCRNMKKNVPRMRRRPKAKA